MRELEFSGWLSRRMAPQSAASRVANCRRVEEHEGDLDARSQSSRVQRLDEANHALRVPFAVCAEVGADSFAALGSGARAD
jgi:hypothetical protein